MSTVIEILKQVGAIITDSHIIYTSGQHGSVYINKDALYPHTKETSDVCQMMAEQYKSKNIDVVVAPALGGIILSQWVAYHLSALSGREVLSVYTEKMPDNNQVLRRGYEKLAFGKSILIVEDVTNTGGSVKKVINSVRTAGGNIVGVCVMVNRRPKEITSEAIGTPFLSLAEFEAVSYEAIDCPLCEKKIPINKSVGHGSQS